MVARERARCVLACCFDECKTTKNRITLFLRSRFSLSPFLLCPPTLVASHAAPSGHPGAPAPAAVAEHRAPRRNERVVVRVLSVCVAQRLCASASQCARAV